mmetsp:Transcript_660/g.1875  ORF Transcript_660/g.1875 Transcript_660/m.1875 type:complete len:273 (-) Transcript_660:108-926(-)
MAALEAGDASGGDDQGAAEGVKRRPRPGEVQEAIDELAQETKRTTLLDRVETQLKGQSHVARLLFGFSIVDDKKTQNDVESQFAAWRKKQESGDELTGLLLFTVQGAIHFLEGPAELLFGALGFFATLADVPPTTMAGSGASIGPVRVLHFTELHGVRASSLWCSFVHPGKATGASQTQVEESNCSELVMQTYKKLLVAALKVKQGGDSDVKSGYRRSQDMMPSVDEVVTLLGKSAADFFFTYKEFHKVFVAPFNLVLHSELLWPMPPALSY